MSQKANEIQRPVFPWQPVFLLLLVVVSHGTSTQCVQAQWIPAKFHPWDLVIAADAIPSEKYAAEEFQQLFQQATHTLLPIRSTGEGNQHILIGTMAYSYSMMPPRKTRVPDNIIIQFPTYHATAGIETY